MALKATHHSEKVSLYQQWQPQHRIRRRYRWYFPQKRTAAKGIFSPELMMTSSWSHSSEGMLPLTRPSHSWVPLVSWLLHSIFSPRALLCYTRHFRLWQLRHLPESILFNSSPSSLAGSVHLGHPWFRGVPPSAEEMLSTLSILPCFDPHPSFWPSSLWASTSVLPSVPSRDWAWTIWFCLGQAQDTFGNHSNTPSLSRKLIVQWWGQALNE